MDRTTFDGRGAFACPSLSYKSSSQVRDRRLDFAGNYLAEVRANRSSGEIPRPDGDFASREQFAGKLGAREVRTCIGHLHRCGRPGHHAR